MNGMQEDRCSNTQHPSHLCTGATVRRTRSSILQLQEVAHKDLGERQDIFRKAALLRQHELRVDLDVKRATNHGQVEKPMG